MSTSPILESLASPRLRWLLVATALGVATASVSCAKSDPTATFVDGTGADGGASEAGVATFGDAAVSALPDNPVECAQDTKQIYVVATDKGLYRFYPDMLKFVRVGTLACPTAAGTFSMAIDKFGIAWIEFTDGRLYRVNTADGTCVPTAFEPDQTGFRNFGMGYVKDSDAGTGETLYVSGDGLAALDTKTFELKFMGSLALGRTELTGLGTQLYAYSVESGVIDALDKTTGATQKQYRTSAILAEAGFAFAQWGGAFWIFAGDPTTTVTKYDPATDVSTVVIPNTGFLIVGAGSSTCAPTTPPR